MKTSIRDLSMSYDFRRVLTLVGMSLLFFSWMLASISASTITGTQNAINDICNLYNTVHTIIYILGLALIIFGATMYAASNIIPGQQKGAFQGYGIGMIMGGIIGVIIAVIAPFILGIITSNTAIASTCT
jgi:hypothetical protein